MRDCALGLEAVARLIAGEPLRRVDEPGFGVLALESAPGARLQGGRAEIVVASQPTVGRACPRCGSCSRV